MVTLLIALGFFILIAILGPWWAPTVGSSEGGPRSNRAGKLWPGLR